MKKKLQVPEKQIQTLIIHWLQIKGIFAWQNDSMGVWDQKLGRYRKRQGTHFIRGTSDILGILPGGRFLAVEVKSATGKLRPEQAAFLMMIKEKGGVAILARTLDDVIKALGPWAAVGTRVASTQP